MSFFVKLQKYFKLSDENRLSGIYFEGGFKNIRVFGEVKIEIFCSEEIILSQKSSQIVVTGKNLQFGEIANGEFMILGDIDGIRRCENDGK